MLKTNSKTEMGLMVTKSGSNPSINVAAICRTTDFVVSPSPCANIGDHKLPNAYDFTKYLRVEPNGTYRFRDMYGVEGSNKGYLGGIFGPVPTIAAADNSVAAQNRALSKLYEKIRNSEVSLNTTIGEGRETLDMLAAVVKSGRNFVDNFKRAKKQASRKAIEMLRNPLQTVGGLELLWSVGLAPLISDVTNIRNHMANTVSPYIDIAVDSRAAATSSAHKVYVSGGATKIEDRELSQRIEYGLIYQISNLHAFENWRLGLTVRPTLLWELTTLSFVFDYFVNIGQYLELLEASILNNGVSFKSGYVTTTSKDEWWIQSDKPFPPPVAWTPTDGHSWHSYEVRTAKKRQVLLSFPAPVRPTVKLPAASSQLLNCAALLSQLISKR